MPVKISKRLLDVKAAAAYLSISRSKLYEWTKAGRIRSIKIHNKRLFDVYDLDRFVDELAHAMVTNEELHL